MYMLHKKKEKGPEVKFTIEIQKSNKNEQKKTSDRAALHVETWHHTLVSYMSSSQVLTQKEKETVCVVTCL